MVFAIIIAFVIIVFVPVVVVGDLPVIPGASRLNSDDAHRRRRADSYSDGNLRKGDACCQQRQHH